MKTLYILGWAFLAAAFIFAAAEVVPRTLPGGKGAFVSAHQLWYAISPGTLVVTKIQVEKIAPLLWNPVLMTVLAFPAWLLCALPGGLLLWRARPPRDITNEQWDDLRSQEESLDLYAALAREAEEAGIDNAEDDRRPDHGGPDLIDDPGAVGVHSEDALLEDLGFTGRSAGDDGGGPEK